MPTDKDNGKKGEFVRVTSGFRHWVTADGSLGPSGEGGFAAEPGRYHLYVSHACGIANPPSFSDGTDNKQGELA